MQGVQELFFVNKKALEVVKSACQSMVFTYQPGPLKVIGQFSLMVLASRPA